MIETISMSVLILLLLLVGWFVFTVVTSPSLTRNWSPDQAIMPVIHFLDKNKVRINNIRDIKYRTTRDFELEFYDRTIAIDDIEMAWLIISPFGGLGVAHTFVSFGLKDGTYLAISIEIRRKKGKRFNPVKAFFRQFEIMYVIADEADVIKVRTNTLKATVRIFPIKTEKEKIRSVFIDMLKRADKLSKAPEFYNTLWNNCATNLIKHTKRFSEKPIPYWDLRYLFPEGIDKIAYRLEMIDTDLPFDAFRDHFDITQVAQDADKAKNFSVAIRQHL